MSGLDDADEKIMHDAFEKSYLRNRWADMAIIFAAPFAFVERLSPKIWQSISVLFKVAK